VRCNLAETEDQQVARYVNGFNDAIQDRLMMQQIWSIAQAQALALKAETLVRTRASKTLYPHIEGSSRNYAHTVEERVVQPKSKQPLPKIAGGKSRAEPVMKCYKCGEEGYVSSNLTIEEICQHNYP
jgi:hypothetical protein